MGWRPVRLSKFPVIPCGPSCAATHLSSEPGFHPDCRIPGRLGFRVARGAGCSRQRPSATCTHAGTDTAHSACAHARTHAGAADTHAGAADTHAGAADTHPRSHANTASHANTGAHADAGATHAGTAQALRGGASPCQPQRGSGRA